MLITMCYAYIHRLHVHTHRHTHTLTHTCTNTHKPSHTHPNPHTCSAPPPHTHTHTHTNTHTQTRTHRLTDNGTLREELTLFPLARNAEGGVAAEHRPGLVPLLVRVPLCVLLLLLLLFIIIFACHKVCSRSTHPRVIGKVCCLCQAVCCNFAFVYDMVDAV